MNNRCVLVLSAQKMPFSGYIMYFPAYTDRELDELMSMDIDPTKIEPARIDFRTFKSDVRTFYKNGELKHENEINVCASDPLAENFLKLIDKFYDKVICELKWSIKELNYQRCINSQLVHRIDSLRNRKLKFLDRVKFILGLKQFPELLKYPQWWENVDLWRGKSTYQGDIKK